MSLTLTPAFRRLATSQAAPVAGPRARRAAAAKTPGEVAEMLRELAFVLQASSRIADELRAARAETASAL